LNVLVLYGSVRSTRQGIKAARFVANACRERGHEVFLVEPFGVSSCLRRFIFPFRFPGLDACAFSAPKPRHDESGQPAVLPPVAINAIDVMHMGHIENHIPL
ncbi:MAG: NAD(P)H-dependent oxidoreductase, partial [Verrucomicrobia subdivision 3 bacterium]|nr:NAD(P)H-dependent oxidoreductase [Limisphaerales bacterium]